MKLTLDTAAGTLSMQDADGERELFLYSAKGFNILSQCWLKVGWNQKYTYTFTWLGRPMIQLPEDMIRVQEVIFRVRPDVIVETGVAHGGSLIYYASLLSLLGQGRVIGIDIDIRSHNRKAIEEHWLANRITLLEGSSTSQAVVRSVTEMVAPCKTVMVILDSSHAADHVLAELEAFAPLVSAGSYIVVQDGLMRYLHDVPRGFPKWRHDNPCAAVEQFLSRYPEFVVEQPQWLFNESDLDQNVTHWPTGYLRRRA